MLWSIKPHSILCNAVRKFTFCNLNSVILKSFFSHMKLRSLSFKNYQWNGTSIPLYYLISLLFGYVISIFTYFDLRFCYIWHAKGYSCNSSKWSWEIFRSISWEAKCRVLQLDSWLREVGRLVDLCLPVHVCLFIKIFNGISYQFLLCKLEVELQVSAF